MPDSKGFPRTNLLYMVNSYKMYQDTAIVPQLEGQTAPEPVPQPEGQDADIFAVPWGHHKLIIDRCRNDPDKALFYLRETLRCGWSRALLLNQLDTDLYERHGRAISNFAATLPEPQSALAQEITRDSYDFDFLTLRERFD